LKSNESKEKGIEKTENLTSKATPPAQVLQRHEQDLPQRATGTSVFTLIIDEQLSSIFVHHTSKIGILVHFLSKTRYFGSTLSITGGFRTSISIFLRNA